MENIPSFTVPVSMLAHITFYLLVIIYVTFTIIFYYHWQNYSVEKAATLQTYLSYFVITIPLLAIMGLSILVI
jgi:tellurite resistance protein TehA-like permease